MNKSKLWFKAKRYGWGWYPCSWEGWLVTLCYMVIIILSAISVDEANHSLSDFFMGFFYPFLIFTSILIIICYQKGEKPRWRWGN